MVVWDRLIEKKTPLVFPYGEKCYLFIAIAAIFFSETKH